MPKTGFLGWAYVTGSAATIMTGSSKTLESGSVLFYSGTSVLSGSNNFVYNYDNNDLFLTGNMYLSGTLNAFEYKTITVKAVRFTDRIRLVTMPLTHTNLLEKSASERKSFKSIRN
jgi:hypothetical protein